MPPLLGCPFKIPESQITKCFSKDHVLELYEFDMSDYFTISFHEILECINYTVKYTTPTSTDFHSNLSHIHMWYTFHYMDSSCGLLRGKSEMT